MTASGHRERRGPGWSLRYRDLGRTRRKALGDVGRREAERRKRDFLADLDAGRIVKKKTGATFGEACQEWLRYIEQDRGRRRSTMRV